MLDDDLGRPRAFLWVWPTLQGICTSSRCLARVATGSRTSGPQTERSFYDGDAQSHVDSWRFPSANERPSSGRICDRCPAPVRTSQSNAAPKYLTSRGSPPRTPCSSSVNAPDQSPFSRDPAKLGRRSGQPTQSASATSAFEFTAPQCAKMVCDRKIDRRRR